MEPEQAPGRYRFRLSDLPDDLIRHIMSFLGARLAVRTCVLSRRWRDLWRSLTRINADFCEFKGETGKLRRDRARFKKFVDTLLLRRDPVPLLDKFWLRCYVPFSANFQKAWADANLWISHALQLHAPVLEVLVLGMRVREDGELFTSRYLRRLALTSLVFSKGFFNQLEMGCPDLEHLFLQDCITGDNISSQTLKILTINMSVFGFLEYDCCISTPSVTALTLFDPEGRVPLLKDMASLVSASVSHADDFSHFDTAVDVHRLLTSLSGVTNLALDFDGAEEITNENNMHWCPEFKDLVSLSLGSWCLESNFYGLTVFLQNSPKLENLTLKLNNVHTRRIVGKLEEKSSTCERLKVVEIICIWDDPLDPLVNRVKEFFSNSGMTSLQIRIKHLHGCDCELIQR